MPDKRARDRPRGLHQPATSAISTTDGYLYLCDRKRDMVISGGVNIYPAEIEAVLIDMPGVRTAPCSASPTGNSARR